MVWSARTSKRPRAGLLDRRLNLDEEAAKGQFSHDAHVEYREEEDSFCFHGRPDSKNERRKRVSISNKRFEISPRRRSLAYSCSEHFALPLLQVSSGCGVHLWRCKIMQTSSITRREG